jgi:hypothetical protein
MTTIRTVERIEAQNQTGIRSVFGNYPDSLGYDQAGYSIYIPITSQQLIGDAMAFLWKKLKDAPMSYDIRLKVEPMGYFGSKYNDREEVQILLTGDLCNTLAIFREHLGREDADKNAQMIGVIEGIAKSTNERYALQEVQRDKDRTLTSLTRFQKGY